MALTLPAGFQVQLESDDCSPLMVYEVSASGTDSSAEMLIDGGFENWNDATDLTSWGEDAPGGGNDVNRDAATKRTGNFSLRIDKVSALFTGAHSTDFGLTAGKWYHVTGWTRKSGAVDDAPSMLVRKVNGTINYLQGDGTWSTSKYWHEGPASGGSWGQLSLWFQGSSDFAVTDKFDIWLGSQLGTAGNYYFDDFSVLGPYNTPSLYFASQAVTWDGNEYTPLALQQSPINEEMGPRVPEVRVGFSNVAHTLRPYLDPVDSLTGARLTCRQLLRDAGGVPLAGSVVKHIGNIERPRRVDQDSIELTSIGLTKGALGLVPPRVTSTWCNVHKFADSVDCNYTSTTTTVGGNTGSTVTVADASQFVAEVARVGASIAKVTVGDESGLTLASAVTGGPETITVDETFTWVNAEAVGFDACDREAGACDIRERRFEFQGFVGEAGLFVNVLRVGDPHLSWVDRAFNYVTTEARKGGPIPLSDRLRSVPVVYGRRKIPGLGIEGLITKWDTVTQQIDVSFFALSEGEIDEVVAWYDDDQRQISTDDETETEGGKEYKLFGVYYRAGGIGLDDDETEVEYDDDGGGDAFTWLRDQNRDFLSQANDTLSRTAYAELLQPRGDNANRPNVDAALFDIKGIICWRYTNAASATHDPADGPARVHVRNPVWQRVDLLTSPRYGLGRIITEADIDFTVTKPDADYCDVAVPSTVATVSALGDSNFKVKVNDTAGFQRGMPVTYFGALHNPAEDDEVVEVHGPTTLELGTSRADAANGDIVTAQPPRFTSDIVLSRSAPPEESLEQISATCMGYTTYNADGKIQLRVEQTGSSYAHFRDTGYSTGYGIIEDSFSWLIDPDQRDPEVNRVHVTFNDQNNESGEAMSTDLDHLEAPHMLKTLEVGLPAVDNKDVAQRIADITRKKHRQLGPGARFIVGPIGIALQPGDLITVTHEVPDWSGEVVRVVKTELMGLGSDEDTLVRLTVEGYDATIYTDTTPPAQTSGNTNEIAITTTVDTSTAGRVTLTWALTGNQGALKWFTIFKDTASMGTTPSLSRKVAGGEFGGTSGGPYNLTHYTYDVLDTEIDSPVYFIVGARLPRGHSVYSAEVSVTPSYTDPTDTQDDPGGNLVYGGDFSNPKLWNVVALAPVRTDPAGDAPVANGGYANPGQGYDNNATTAATAAPAAGAGNAIEHRWNHGGAGSGLGYFEVVASMTGGPSGNGIQVLTYSTDNGATWINFGTTYQAAEETFTSPIISGVTTKLACKAYQGRRGGAVTGNIVEVDFMEYGAGEYSEVVGNQATIRGDGGAAFGQVYRRFPGEKGQGAYTIPNGKVWTVSLEAVLTSGAAADDILVDLYNRDTLAYVNLMTITAAEITSSRKVWVAKYTAPSELVGDYDIYVRTVNLGAYNVDKLQVEDGDKIHAFTLHKDEVNIEPDYSHGRRQAFARGEWDGTRNAGVS